MRLSTAVTVALTVLLVTSTFGTVAGTASPSDPSQEHVTPAPSTTVLDVDDPETEYDPTPADPRQVIRLSVEEDGSVEWTIESRFLLEENETDEFAAFAEAVATGEIDGGYDADQYESFVDEAAQSTDREMTIEDAGWNDHTLESTADDDDDRKLGVISYSFTWTEFAVVEDDQIYFGDAFETDDGVWLSTLLEGQRLVVERPSNYSFDTVPSTIQDGTVVWNGPTELSADDLEIVFSRDDGNGGTGGSGTNGGNGTTGGDDDGPDGPTGTNGEGSILSALTQSSGVVLLLIVAATVFAAVVVSRHQRSTSFEDDGESTTPRASGHAVGSEVDDREDEDGVTHEFDEADATTEPTHEIDVELLSDEERVKRMLSQNGGRMKQATIVKETGWSDAKVSQLLSEMDRNDEIEKLRIGRENLITLPDVDPTEIE